MILSHGGSKILTACKMLQISIAHRQMKAKIHSFPTMYILGGGRCGRNGSNQGFAQELGLKQGFLECTNMDYLTSEWPGMPNFKVDANFDVFPQKYG